MYSLPYSTHVLHPTLLRPIPSHFSKVVRRQQPGRIEAQFGWGGIQIRAHPPRANENNENNPSSQVHWPAKLQMSEAESAVLTEEAPEALKCKITHEIMSEPAVVNGHCYQRAVITEWLTSNRVDPMTRAPCTLADIR